MAYNGAQGVPIREEVLERHGDTVITRNGYGAKCLNTPDVLFADVDFDTALPPGCIWQRCVCWRSPCYCPRGGCSDRGAGWQGD